MPDKAVAEMERLRLLVEGVNNKIRVLQRRAYGYRDEEYLKLKIVAAFLPPLPRNAVFNPHESAQTQNYTVPFLLEASLLADVGSDLLH